MSSFYDDFDLFNKSDEFYSLMRKIEELLEKKSMDITELYKLLKDDDTSINQKDIYKVLQFMLVNRGCIIKEDYWNKKAKYHLLDKHHSNSSYSRSYYELNKIDKIDSILLIADTHIGNEIMEDMRLINNIYNFAIKNNIKYCFHLGDLFEGSKNNPQEIERQIEKFILDYPNVNEIKTYSIIGNHDKTINDYLQNKPFWQYSDLRGLSLYNSNFYMFPREKVSSLVSNRLINFSHKFYVSWINRDCHLNCIDDLENENNFMFLDYEYDILISAHLHQGIIYTEKYKYSDKEHVYIGIPSTSKINIESPVGIIINFNYQNNLISDINIEVLSSDLNRNIYINNEINFNFNKNNKVYKKVL